jgi:hypothetical protein
MRSHNEKPTRLAVIEALPTEMQENALVDWRTVADIIGCKDAEHAREMLISAGVPLVRLGGHMRPRRLPRWGVLRDWLRSREQPTAA